MGDTFLEFFSGALKAFMAGVLALILLGATFGIYPQISPAIVYGLWLYVCLKALR